MLNISTRLCFYSSIFSFSKGSSFLSWNIHTRDTNCEDVIPEITFGPCSCWETVKRRKMHTLGIRPSLLLTLSFAHPSSTLYADRSTGFQPRISWKSTEKLRPNFPASGLVRNSTCAFRAPRVCESYTCRESMRARKLFAEDRYDTVT